MPFKDTSGSGHSRFPFYNQSGSMDYLPDDLTLFTKIDLHDPASRYYGASCPQLLNLHDLYFDERSKGISLFENFLCLSSSLLSASAEAELRRFAPCLRPQPSRESGHREVYPAKPLDLPFIYSFKNDNGNFSFWFFFFC